MTGNQSSGSESVGRVLEARWLGKTQYLETLDLQKRLFSGRANYLLLCEHEPVYTIGVRGSTNFRKPRKQLGAPVEQVRRGGDVTFHGPGQLVGYPIVTLEDGITFGSASYVSSIEKLVISVLEELGCATQLIKGSPGVWTAGSNPQKVAAIGVRQSRGRTMHGFAINVSTDLSWFEKIIPCGIEDKGVTSLAELGIDVSMETIADLIVSKVGTALLGAGETHYEGVVHNNHSVDLSLFSSGAGPGEPIKPEPDGVSVRLKSRLSTAGVTEGLQISERKPEWMKVKFKVGENYSKIAKRSSELNLATVCESAGCPNIYECWNEGTATFMLLGERCTRACGFCLVDTRKPEAIDLDEPVKVANTVTDLGIDFAVLTMVARDDLADGGAAIVADTINQIHKQCPGVGVEVLISDLAGERSSLETVMSARPEILNHNIETVARLQRAVRPSASYNRSMALLARGSEAGMVTKSGLILGMGETELEVKATLRDLANVGVKVATVGQYLRPTSHHLPISRWVTPAEFSELKEYGESVGISHVEATPLTRSSHHAGKVAASVGAVVENQKSTLG